MPDTRKPTTAESEKWSRFQVRFDRKTKPLVQALIAFAHIARDANAKVIEITGNDPRIIGSDEIAIISEIGRRGQIIDNIIQGVILQRYVVAFDADSFNVVATDAPESDSYPIGDTGLGLAPIIVAAGIFAVTLLIAADQTVNMLEQRAKIEAIKLQQKMLEADRQMMALPEGDRKRWETWKKSAADTAAQAARNISGTGSFIEKFFGSKGTTIIIAGILGIAAAYVLVPMLRRN